MEAHKTVKKKVINSPETCVDDNLRGVVALYPQLHLHPKHRVVTIRQKVDSERVAVLGGGGSGHEPFAAGLIGAGLLDGAVAGGIFASPPTGNVLYAIAHLYKYNSGGVLVVIGNYTGDRLNFGKAIEKAKIAGIKVEGLIVGEDVASSHKKTGGRSMVGEVLFYKLCGAMAAKGYDLASIKNMAITANKSMATLGVCLSPCSLPGQPPLFDIPEGEMSLGAGVHGEAGIQSVPLDTARNTVALIMDKILDHLKLKAGDRVAVMLNNLGGASVLEMNIVAAETKDYLVNKKLTVERMYSGHLKTSLEMHGFQICVLHLTKENGDLWLEFLDLPTDAISWTGGTMSVRTNDDHGDDKSLLQGDELKIGSGPALSPGEQRALGAGVRAAAAALGDSAELLNRLDSGCGDGDCGITLNYFANAILSYLEKASLKYPARVLWEVAEMAETEMGGTSGGLYSLGLAAAAQAIAKAKYNDRAAWLSALEAALLAISQYGGAEPGDRTMLDSLQYALAAFKQHVNAERSVLLREITAAADRGARDTAHMPARAGRASYVSAGYVSGEDAGARGAAVWLAALLARLDTEHTA